MSIVYTLGYLKPEAMTTLEVFVANGAGVIDIRYAPVSRRPEWTKKRLIERFGATRYVHVQALGNINYRSRGQLPIRLADPETGLRRVVTYLASSGLDVCLLCACQNVATCHRRIVANLIQEAFPCQIVHAQHTL